MKPAVFIKEGNRSKLSEISYNVDIKSSPAWYEHLFTQSQRVSQNPVRHVTIDLKVQVQLPSVT